MKKTLALVLAIVTMLCAVALAETVDIDNTNAKLDIPAEIEEYELTDDEIEEGMVAFFANEDDTIEICVYVMEDSEPWTTDEMLEQYEEDTDVADKGTTNINGIEAVYAVYEGSDGTYVDYMFADGNNLVEVQFYVGDDNAKVLSQSIMNSLSL